MVVPLSSWEMVVPRNLNDSTAVTVLFMMVRGVSPEVHDHLHCFERVELQVVKTAPDNHLLNLLSCMQTRHRPGFKVQGFQGFKVFLFVTYSIILDIISSEM